jgi:hypothetical protein
LVKAFLILGGGGGASSSTLMTAAVAGNEEKVCQLQPSKPFSRQHVCKGLVDTTSN